MDISADLVAPCSPAELFAWVDDLSGYPQWMGLVHRAEAIASAQGPGEQGSANSPSWDVELRARIGPFARSKRLAMTRTVHTPCSLVVFERKQTGERKQSVWRLSAAIEPVEAGTRLEMHLHYGGGLWTAGLLERALLDEINASRDRLLALINRPTR